MPTREQLESALINADAAGDSGAAKQLANALKNYQPEDKSSSLGEKIVGGLETAASIASGIVTEPAAGIAALGTLALTQDPLAAEAVAQGVRESGFQPTTKTGKEFLQATGEAVSGGLESAREFVGQALPEGQFQETFEKRGVGPALGEAAFEAGAYPAVAAVIEGLPSAAVEAIGLKGAGRAGKVTGEVSASPSEGIKRIFRGGEEGRRAISETIEAFEAATGEAPTLGQATGRQTLQAFESTVGKFVGFRSTSSIQSDILT